MNLIFKPCFLLVAVLLLNPTFSATIIITPSDSNVPSNTNILIQNPSPQSINSVSMVQAIMDYFGCALFVNGSCTRCQNNYILDNEGKCSRVSECCRTFNIDEGLCSQCVKGFIIVDGICYFGNLTNPLKNHCVIWSNQECLKCQKSYYLSRGTCKPVDPDFQCRNWNNKGVCLFCNLGYFLLERRCVQSPKLVKCSDNQFLGQSGKCELAPANCQTWDPYNDKCVKCFNQFDFVQWKCRCSAKGYCSNEGCERYNLENRKQCDKCQDGFVLSENGRCNEKPLPKNCAKWNENKTECSQCNQYSFLNTVTRQCVFQVQNCQTYGPTGNCTTCNEKYELINGKCDLIVVIANCQKYDSQNRKLCSLCRPGYSLQNNQCSPKALPAHCLKWNSNFTGCYLCESQWILNAQNGQCVQIVQNCLSYGSSGECNSCAQKYELVNQKCELIVVIPYCQTYSTQNRRLCVKCERGYFVENGLCKEGPLPSNCLSWNQQKSACGHCQENFILTVKGQCVAEITNCKKYDSIGQCTQCVDQYEIVGSSCQPIILIPNCILYNPSNRKECAQCKPGFVVQKSECKEKSLPNNCVKWDEAKVSCAQCKTSFKLNIKTGQCEQEVKNCKKYSTSGECITCVDDYEMTQNICHLKANTMNSSQFYGCDSWNFTSSKCNTCHLDFNISKQGHCFYNEDKCLQRNERSYCTKCQQGYVINGGNCQIKSDAVIQSKSGCKVYDWVNNNCLVCEDEFVRINENSCEKPIDNCAQQGKDGCTKCLANFDLKNGKCESFATSKCVEKDGNNNCKKCENSLALIQGECRTFKQLGTILLDYTQFSPEKLKDKIIIFTDSPKV